MMTRRRVRFTVLSLMSLAAAGSVMAARPVDAAAHARVAALPHAAAPSTPHAATLRDLTIPTDLNNHRLKVRLDRSLGARILPNGQLISLRGRDLTGVNTLLDSLGVQLAPATTLPDATIQKLRQRAELRSGNSTADVGATFWVNGEANSMGRVAGRLSRLDAFELVTFARQAPQPATRIIRHRPERTDRASANNQWSGAIAGNPTLEAAEEFDRQREAMIQQGRIAGLEAAARLRLQGIADREAATLAHSVKQDPHDAPARGGSRANSCCFQVFVESVREAEVFGPMYLMGFENDIVDEAACQALAQEAARDLLESFTGPQDWAQLVTIEFSEDGTGPGSCRAYGACCTDSGVAGAVLRGGSDTYVDDCDEIWSGTFTPGDPEPVVPGSVGDPWTWEAWTRAYANCDVCRLQFGMCCFTEDAVDTVTTEDYEDTDPASTTNDKFRACNVADAGTANAPGVPTFVQNWAPANAGGRWWQPDMEALPLWQYTGIGRSGQVDFMPQWQGKGLLPIGETPFPWDATEGNPWDYTNPWMRLKPGEMRVIGTSRLVTNNDSSTAEQRCQDLEGVWEGYVNESNASSFPKLLFDGDRRCIESTTVLGGCMDNTGAIIITSQLDCREEAWNLGLNLQGEPNPLWLANMLDPSLLELDVDGNLVHRIHKNQWRPTWTLWFTPPSTTCPFNDCGDATDPGGVTPAFLTWCPPQNPGRSDAIDPLCGPGDSPEYIVPPWEYIGTYAEWTGWDPLRWFNDGVTLGLTETDFLEWFPLMDGSEGLYPAHATGDAVGIFDPGFYGHAVEFGLPPTCTEFENTPNFGLATQRGVTFPWDNPDDPHAPFWLVYPTWNPWVYGWQVDNNAGNTTGGVVAEKLYPFNDGWNRWTASTHLFDYGQDTPYPVDSPNARYLQSPAAGATTWIYQGDMAEAGAIPPAGGQPEDYDAYVFSYLIPTDQPESGDPTRGSCFFPHSMQFPTLLETPELEGEQECYIGNYCNDDTCCDYVETVLPGCCGEAGQHTTWDSECVQVAVDRYLLDQGTPETEYDAYTCRGITPFLAPSWPVSEDGPYDPTYVWPAGAPAASILYTPGQYNPDPRNVTINPYLDAVLPTYIDPSYVEGTCEVADTSLLNSLAPPLPVPPDNAAYSDYAQVRDQAGRLYQFMPRCQGIFSSAGQCNVPGSLSGRSAWDAIADDENVLIGCQDYDCCMRVIATMLQEKDAIDTANEYSDLEWINFAHMYFDEDDPLPPLAGQWTPYMAMKARELCYPSVESSDTTPDFFPLQLHAGADAYQQRAGSPSTASTEYIEGPDGSDVSGNDALRQLIYAPFSWSDPQATTPVGECVPPHQNIYEMCPAPFYRAEGMGMWPAGDPFEFGNTDFFETWASGMSYLSQSTGQEIDAYGEGVNIAVLAESAWLQTWAPPLGGPVQGAVHEDLGNVILEGSDPEMGLPAVTLDFSDPTLAARGTAVLGVLAATDNGLGVTGMAHHATTYFFPTRAVPAPGLGPQERLEDAFLHALSVLDSGDVLLLAFESTAGTGFLLDDPEVADLVSLAASSDISVIVPAGDRAVALPEDTDFPGIANVTVVGGAAPGSDDQYLRWWSSNYSTRDTVSGQFNGLPNVCAWGGAVTTTGGNANLTLLTIDGAAEVDPADPDSGVYQLTETGRARSYTNDFGAQLDGSVAAASQVAASVACAQSFCKTWYDDPLIPSVLQGRLFDTAVYGNAGGQPAGLLNTPGNVGGTFTWDLDEANPETRSVGRIPRLGRFLENLAFVTPEDADFSEDIPFRIVRMDIVSGVLEDGSRFSLALEGDDEWVRMSSEQTGPGYPAIDFYSPGAIYYSSHRDFTDILLTCAIGEEMIATDGFGVYTNRIGPDEAGRFKVYVYDFSRKAWRQFTPDQTPADNDPQPWLAEPWPGAPAGLSRYLEPGTNRMYIRVMTSAITDEDYHYYLDFVEVQGLTGSDRPN